MKRKISLPKTTNIRKASSISKIKVKITHHPNMNDYTGAKMKGYINEIMKSFNDYNLKTKSKVAKLIKAQGNNIAKESIIILLREDLDYHKNINKNYNIYKKYATDICDYYKQNFEEILEYKANLRYDLKDFIKLVDGYEEEIGKCKVDRKVMIKTSEDIIKYKKSEKDKMGERLRKLNNDLEKQDKKLNTINNLLKEYQEQNENYMDKLNSSELTHMERYEILEDKYKKLLAKYNYYIDKEMKNRKIELDYKDKNLCKEEKDLADLKLKDNLLKNDYLKEIANDIKNQIKEIELVNQKYLEEEKLLRFLGKVFYNKVKQRRAEMELTQENMSKTKSTINSKKKLNTEGKNNINNVNNVNIQISLGNLRENFTNNINNNFTNTTKNSKSKINFTTSISG